MSGRDALAQVKQRDAQLARVEVVAGGRLEATLTRLQQHIVRRDDARHEQLALARKAMDTAAGGLRATSKKNEWPHDQLESSDSRFVCKLDWNMQSITVLNKCWL